jgi:hypothetical protein
VSYSLSDRTGPGKTTRVLPTFDPGNGTGGLPEAVSKTQIQPPMDADERRYFKSDDRVSRGLHLRLSAFICG